MFAFGKLQAEILLRMNDGTGLKTIIPSKSQMSYKGSQLPSNSFGQMTAFV
jgi:hypothetical protein